MNLFNFEHKSMIFAVACFLIFNPCSVVLADATLKFHGTLQAGSCSADAVDVEFGTVQVDTIPVAAETRSVTNVLTAASGTGSQRFSLTVACTGTVNDVQFKINGTAAPFNHLVLSSDVDGLGVLIANIGAGNGITEIGNSNSATNIVPGTWYDLVNGAGTYSLMAALVKSDSAKFSGGDFNATATIALQIP